jgi:hypothetical protein
VLAVRRIVSRGRIGVAVASAAAAVACSSAASADAALTLRDSDGKKLAAFNSVACKVASKAKVFTGTATAAGWKLSVKIQPFGGFGFYHVGYGNGGKANFTVSSGDTTYSNKQFPGDTSTPETGEGGNIGFPGGGDKIGIAFGTAFQVGETHEYASLGGLAACS